LDETQVGKALDGLKDDFDGYGHPLVGKDDFDFDLMFIWGTFFAPWSMVGSI